MSDGTSAATGRGRRWRHSWVRDGLLAWAFFTVAGAIAIHSCVTLEPSAAPPPEAVGRAMAALRATLEERPEAGLGDAARVAVPGAVRIVLWSNGLPVFRSELEPRDLGELVAQGSVGLREARQAGRFEGVNLAASRLQLSFVVAEGPVLEWPTIVAAFSFVTTLDGAALRLRDRTMRLYPDDLLRRHLYSAYIPLPGGQMKGGLDVPAVVESLWFAAHLPDESWEDQKPSLRRFRTVEYVERPGAEPAELVAGRTVNEPPRTVEDYRRTAREGVQWLSRMIRSDGRFQYDYDPLTDGPFDLGYSLPRHAGAAYFLSFAYRKTGDPTARETARKAIDYLVTKELRDCGKAPGRCVGQGGAPDAGSAALSVVAMAEYERGTNEGRYLPQLKRVLEYILWLQEPNGDFVHVYDVEHDRRSPDRLLYYSGEAALALVEAYRVLQDPALLPRIRSALDFLTKENWSFFGSAYFFGEEHWTCIASNEAFPEVQDEAYLEFCEDFAGFLRQMQTAEGERPYGFEGTYLLGPFLAPRTTPVAGRTESTVATYKLGVAMGRPNLVVLEQIRRSLSFLVRMQYRPDSSPFFSRPDLAAGGMPGGLDDPVVRIDYVQHAGNALLGGADILGDWELGPP
ncbi:MAG: hypothetical protein HY907_22705 [Deltaproteobacteria bacterium]|nr:hypothetical protein [Deltaproteobacteria bacterium]